MALPTLKPFYMVKACSRPGTAAGGADRISRLAQRQMRVDENRDLWRQNHRYFKASDVRSQKQHEWTSESYYQESMGKYTDKINSELKVQQLAKRRTKLRDLLNRETSLLEDELKALSPDKRKEMKERADALRTAREERRREIAEAKLAEHWRSNCPQLREVESRCRERLTHKTWQEQIIKKREDGEKEREEKIRYEREIEERRGKLFQEEEEKRRLQKQKREQETRQALESQMAEVKAREEEALELERHQAQLMREKISLEEAEEQRKELELKQRQQIMSRKLLKQARAQLKRKCQQIQEALELDIKILEQLAAEEKEEEIERNKKKEKERLDAEEMRDIMRQQLQLEIERERELDTMYREEADRQWSRREADWERERKARESLMEEVLLTRAQQLEDKMADLKQQQLENIERREDLLRELEMAAQLTARDDRHRADEQKRLQKELKAQALEKHRSVERAQLLEERELEKQRLLEEDYEARVQEEADILTSRYHQPRYHGRVRTDWYY